jgi:hypothetical protein
MCAHQHKILVATMNNYGKYYGTIKSKVCFVLNILFYNESKTNMVYGCRFEKYMHYATNVNHGPCVYEP